ncbi:VOC family protein [Pseudonocardia sp. CA-107938]|uniref:VOC family protein n=1 Tax=Pseudonocardia sp. CA-107938 TaxID=3240021 RepID=UPI003D8CF7E2
MSIHPTLRYDDAKAAIGFLVSALGFTEKHVSIADDGSVGHAELAWGADGDEGVVMLGTRTADRRFDTGRAVVYLAVAPGTAVDPLYDRAVAAGATVMHELVDQPYGSREFAVADPEGNVWCVGTYRPS